MTSAAVPGSTRRPIALWVALGAAVVWNLISWQFPFFWDNILNSRIAHWYLETGFSQLVVPENLDAGHPPFFSMYIAGLWSLFGKSLAVAHAGMLPFLLGAVWAWWKLCGYLLPSQWRPWGMLILALEPTWLAQSSMVTPDLALVACLLMGWVGIREKKSWLVALMAVLMCAVTFRGILMVPILYLTEWVWEWKRPTLKELVGKAVKYLPAAGLSALWLWYHWQEQGWLLSPPPETYGGHREMLGIKGVLRNIGLVGWRMLDFGRVFLWIFLGVASFVGWQRLRRHFFFSSSLRLFLLPAIWLTVLFIPFSNPIGHRYFMVTYLLLGLLTLNAIDVLESSWRRWLVPAVLGMGLVCGNLWIYPARIAQGWDASLAHWHYFSLKDDFLTYAEENLPPNTAASFPFLVSEEFVSLQTRGFTCVDKDGVGGDEIEWMVESNVSNGFSDGELEAMRSGNGWRLEWEKEQMGVYIRIYQQTGLSE